MKKTNSQLLKVFVTNSALETQILGAKFARSILAQAVQGVSLLGDNVIALYGDLGSGKTTFVQGLTKGLGVNKRIISPTFMILRTYNIKNTKKKLKMFYHADLYRIRDQKDSEELGLKEIMNNSQNVIAIEWAEKIKSLLPKKRWEIYFDYLSESKRRIKLVSLN